ncbi:MAG: type II toxin-antitoxin system RelE/ParE family toxin [Acidobacteriia bacterium]|nr:type II toxin-antitoxin system RelE/ParE family toxin [Terriglobia bacterium]
MRRSVRFHPAASQDAEEAAAWYAERSVRAAVRFLDELGRLIDLIAVSPDRFPVFDAGLRRAVFRRFPFYVVFRADDVNVVVLAVAHGKRRPRFWRDRT